MWPASIRDSLNHNVVSVCEVCKMANKGRSESRTNRSNLMSHDSSPLSRRAWTACHYRATDILSLPAMKLLSESTNRLSCSQKPRPAHKLVKSLCGSQKPHLAHETNKSLSVHNSNDSKTQISSVSDSNEPESKEWSFLKMLVGGCCGS